MSILFYYINTQEYHNIYHRPIIDTLLYIMFLIIICGVKNERLIDYESQLFNTQ